MAKRPSKPALIEVRDRIVETRRVKASEIAEHPGNWRDHPARGYGSQALT